MIVRATGVRTPKLPFLSQVRTRPWRVHSALAAALATLVACEAPVPSEQEADAPAFEPDTAALAGPEASYAVGTMRIEIAGLDGRKLPVQLWYPAAESARAEAEAGHPTYEFEPPGPRREQQKSLIAKGKSGCVNATMHAAIDAPPEPAIERFPLLVTSHHFEGTRFSTFTINEQLARRGFLVASPDHVGGTIYERQGGNLFSMMDEFSARFLKVRAGDVQSVLDALTNHDPSIPAPFRGRIDDSRIGAFGHSMGGISIGLTAARDARIKAAAFLAVTPFAPLNTLLMGSASVSSFRAAGLYVSALEDKVVALAMGGPAGIRSNYEKQWGAAWLVEVRDTGHMSFADDSGLVGEFNDGCVRGARVTFPYLPYTPVDGARAREIAARYTAAFFAHRLLGASPAPLSQASPPRLVSVKSHGIQGAAAPAGSDALCKGAEECTSCCLEHFPKGLEAQAGIGDKWRSCYCDACATECADSFCAEPISDSEPETACSRCLTRNAARCTNALVDICQKDPQCSGYVSCEAGC